MNNMNNMNINSAMADTLDIGNTDTEKKTGLIGFYNYTVVLTYIGMWIGFLGVMLAIKDRYVGSLICLMLAGVCDMFDGTIASTKKDRTRDERTFGIQIDSLSDMLRRASGSVGILCDSKDFNSIYRHICIHSLRAYPSGIL